MRTFSQWMEEYGESHKHPSNQLIHKFCVPLIMFSVIGLIWEIPTPSAFSGIPFLNWATIFIFLTLLFYIRLNFLMSVGMLIQFVGMSAVAHFLFKTGGLLKVSSLIFVIAWIFQFIGHKIEGKKPSFLKDIIFLLVGPLWVTRFLYKKIGIDI